MAIESEPKPSTRLTELCTVSCYWWNVITNASSLWNNVQSTCSKAPIAIRRSKTLPLDIQMLFDSKSEQEKVEAFMKMVCGHVDK